MIRACALLGSMAVLVTAIVLAIDLGVAWLEQRPAPGRHALIAVGLVALITARICERLLTGTL